MPVSAVSEALLRLLALTGYCTVAIPVLSSGVIRCEPCGEMTAVTWGAVAALSSVSLRAAALAGLASVVPSVAWKMSWALVPPAAGKSCCTWSSAVWDCEPGMVNVLSSWPPAALAPSAPATITRSQIETTSHLCAKHARPSLYRTFDIRNTPFATGIAGASDGTCVIHASAASRAAPRRPAREAGGQRRYLRRRQAPVTLSAVRQARRALRHAGRLSAVSPCVMRAPPWSQCRRRWRAVRLRTRPGRG